MNENLLLLYLAAIPLMGSPGPATLTVAATAAAFGARPALPYLCGIILGTVGAPYAGGLLGEVFVSTGTRKGSFYNHAKQMGTEFPFFGLHAKFINYSMKELQI